MYNPADEIKHIEMYEKCFSAFCAEIGKLFKINNAGCCTIFTRFMVYHMSINQHTSLHDLYDWKNYDYTQLADLLLPYDPKKQHFEVVKTLLNNAILKLKNCVYGGNEASTLDIKTTITNNERFIVINGKIVRYFENQDKYFVKYLTVSTTPDEYNQMIFCILYRYKIFMYDLESMCLSADADIYGKYSVDIEGFANIFNRHCKYYCSLFPDLEKPFGAIDSFLFLDVDKAKDLLGKKSFILSVNPPYDEAIIKCAIMKAKDICRDPDIKVVGVAPAWESTVDYGIYRFNDIVKEIPNYRADIRNITYYDFIREKSRTIGKTKTILFTIN